MEDFLKKSNVFKKVDHDFYDYIQKNSKEISVKAWDLIIREWSKDTNKIYILKEWKVSCRMPITSVEEIHSWDFFWELPFLTEKWVHTWNFIAESNSKLVKINKNVIKKLLQNPLTKKEVEKIVMKRIAKNKSLFNK